MAVILLFERTYEFVNRICITAGLHASFVVVVVIVLVTVAVADAHAVAATKKNQYYSVPSGLGSTTATAAVYAVAAAADLTP